MASWQPPPPWQLPPPPPPPPPFFSPQSVGDCVPRASKKPRCSGCQHDQEDIVLVLGRGESRQSFTCCRMCLSRLEFFAELFVIRRQEIILEDVDPSRWPVFYENFVLHRTSLQKDSLSIDTGRDMMPFFIKFHLDHEIDGFDAGLSTHISDCALDDRLWDWNAPEDKKIEAISSITRVLSKCEGHETILANSFRRGLAALEKALKHSYNKFTIENFSDLAPLVAKASVPTRETGELAFGNDLDFLHGFAGRHLEHVIDDPDESIFDNNLFPYLLHAGIRLSFAQKQRDRAIREKNDAVRARDAAVQAKEDLLADVQKVIGKYN